CQQMINSEDFAKRLEKVITYYGETASSFAEKIGVQRSSISHILSGRNKPSLDFVLKVLSEFPEVELYWLLNGKGQFPSVPSSVEKTVKTFSKTDLDPNVENLQIPSTENKSIERIVIFYKDGSFRNFENP
ncbi:MAG TPA: helix-turn-helix transcriptional regulator, partial [Aquaticitalea sp.]|nr:helix-turn-helix transcriptional regulator [Aquaticitalea sp.]